MYTNHLRFRDEFLIMWHGQEYIFPQADMFCNLIAKQSSNSEKSKISLFLGNDMGRVSEELVPWEG